jgi:NAD-dependent dihydropyrimidine dehydrogenase PreA subunit/flavodoxin
MIFYFSGTGNTRWAAEKLAQETGERLLFIPEALKGDCAYTLEDNERIGFCYPVHGWRPPHIVRQFISKLRFTNLHATPHYCFALCTCGDSIGKSMEFLNKDLQQVGIQAVSMFSLIMPESYVCLPFMYTDKPEREQQKIAQAEKELERYAVMIRERQPNEVHTKRGLTPWTFSHVIGAYFNGKMITDKKFTVDADLCLHCGRCEKQCPTGDIKLTNGLPQWLHDGSCTCCLSCYHHCPVHAINYGSITRQRGQYYFGHKTAKD